MRQLLRDYIKYRERKIKDQLKTDRKIQADPYSNLARLKEIQAIKQLLTSIK